MRILIVTPSPPRARSGNRRTATRWARILRELKHHVRVAQAYEGQKCDLLIAMHARRSAPSVIRYRAERPLAPLVVAMTGTDLYGDLPRSRTAQRSVKLASRLVLLQWDGLATLPRDLAHKARVIHQSAVPPRRTPQPLQNVFEVCVIGHLRPVKDPFRAAMAARRLPESSRIRIVHLGKALLPSMERRARAQMASNPRYRWLGELSGWQARLRLARSRLMVLSSVMEGGANVLSEALAAGVPVLASRISGSTGLLGDRYSGYFDVRDTAALAELMLRAEQDPAFYVRLQRQCAERTRLVDPEREKAGWAELLEEFFWEACGEGGTGKH